MSFRRHPLLTGLLALLAAAFLSLAPLAGFAAQDDWSRVSYPIAAQELGAQSVILTNTARAPPTASANMMATGTAFAQTGNLRALDGVETTGAVYAFLRSSIAPNRAGDLPTVTQNRIRHNQAVEDANAQFEANGLRTTTEVTLDSCTGTRCRADTVIQGEAGQTSTPVPEGFKAYDLDGNQLDSIPLGSNGQGIAIVETKTGNATLSGNQSVGYPEVGQGTVSGVGNNANSANLGGVIPADTPVIILTPE